jgi:iron-sulfur cluster repair protein YtfE (RIC family)
MSTASQSIREIAANHPSALKVFERFDIDACALADKSLSEVCAGLRLSIDQVVEKLTALEVSESGSAIDPAGLSLIQLIQHNRSHSSPAGAARIAGTDQDGAKAGGKARRARS